MRVDGRQPGYTCGLYVTAVTPVTGITLVTAEGAALQDGGRQDPLRSEIERWELTVDSPVIPITAITPITGITLVTAEVGGVFDGLKVTAR